MSRSKDKKQKIDVGVQFQSFMQIPVWAKILLLVEITLFPVILIGALFIFLA